MSRVSDNEDEGLVAMDTEEVGVGLGRVAAEKRETKPSIRKKEGVCERTMGQLPEEVLEYILSFLSPYQEHKTAALVCKQWYRLIKGTSSQMQVSPAIT